MEKWFFPSTLGFGILLGSLVFAGVEVPQSQEFVELNQLWSVRTATGDGNSVDFHSQYTDAIAAVLPKGTRLKVLKVKPLGIRNGHRNYGLQVDLLPPMSAPVPGCKNHREVFGSTGPLENGCRLEPKHGPYWIYFNSQNPAMKLFKSKKIESQERIDAVAQARAAELTAPTSIFSESVARAAEKRAPATIAQAAPSTAVSSPRAYSVHPISVAAERLINSMYQSCDIASAQSPPSACGDFRPDFPSYSQARRLPRYQDSKLETVLDYPNNSSDCSSFVSGVIAAAGLRIRANASPQSVGAPTTSDMIHWGERKGDCFAPVAIDQNTPPLLPGDLIVNFPIGRHVVLVTHLDHPEDPLGLNRLGIKSVDECDGSALSQRLDAIRGGILYKYAQITEGGGKSGPFFAANASLEASPVSDQEFLRRACLAKFGRVSDGRISYYDGLAKQKQTVAVLRHKMTPECINSQKPVVPRGHECIDSCPHLQQSEEGLAREFPSFSRVARLPSSGDVQTAVSNENAYSPAIYTGAGASRQSVIPSIGPVDGFSSGGREAR